LVVRIRQLPTRRPPAGQIFNLSSAIRSRSISSYASLLLATVAKRRRPLVALIGRRGVRLALGSAAAVVGGGVGLGCYVASSDWLSASASLFSLGGGVVRAETAPSAELARTDEDASAVSRSVDDDVGKFSWRLLGSLLLPDLHLLLAAVVASVAAALLNVQIPVGISQVVDSVMRLQGADWDQLKTVMGPALRLLGVYAAQSGVTFAYISLLGCVGENLAARLRRRLMATLLTQDVAFFDRHRSAELLSRLSGDVQDFKSAFKSAVSQGLRNATQTVGSLGYLVAMSPRLSAFFLLYIPLVVAVGLGLGSMLRALSKRAAAQQAAANAVAHEALTQMRSVKAFGMEAEELRLYEGQVEEAAALARRLALGIGLFQALSNLAVNGVVLTVLCGGGVCIGRGELTAGELTAYLVGVQTAMRSAANLSPLFGHAIKGATAGGRVFRLLDSRPCIEIDRGRPGLLTELAAPVSAGQDLVRLENVRFAYPGRPDAVVLDGVSLTVPSGCVVAVCGRSGAGKSTVTQLLTRFYDPTDGRVLLAGRDLRSYDPGWVRDRLVGLIPQEPALFCATIRENIRYGRPEATDAEVEAAARLAQAHKFIKAFPRGYDTHVGERGLAVSGGQKQRIAIARALLKDPKLLILDEATSALDSESERLVQAALQQAMQGRTVIVIAHRLSTIESADYVVVMGNGRVLEQGKRSDLLQKRGHYWAMVERHETDLID
ncbi:hypothetical protein BOX15_Mlig014609g1, partial [Macrostomum lignano]